jgi:hypothetical protein
MAKTTSSVNYLVARRPFVGDPIASIIYDDNDRPISVTYKLGQSGTARETVTFSYSAAGHITFKGVEYRGYELDLWKGALKRITLLNTQTRNNQEHTRVFDPVTQKLLTEILYEIKKMNIQLALITDEEL